MTIFIYLGVFIISYLLGSFPTAYFVVKKSTGKDIRKEETGNVGAMNTARITGKLHLFLIVFLVDAIKAIAALYIAYLFLQYFDVNENWIYTIAAFAVVLGHCYSVYFRIKDGIFSGGKAISTMAGVLLFINFFHLLLPILLIMLLIVGVTRNFFATQFFAAILLPIVAQFLDPHHFVLCFVCVIPVLIKQSPRVVPMFKGKEPKLYYKGKKKN